MNGGRDATSALLNALRQHLGVNRVNLETIRSRPWASVTFAGARHQITFRLEGEGAGDAADRFLADLPSAEFPMRGHLLADVEAVAREPVPGGVRITVEALTVEEG